MFFIFKIIISAVIIALAAWLAGRHLSLAGFIIALPLMSILSIALSYMEFRDMQKVNEFAVSILVAVPLSLTFFVPFVLNRWLKMSFTMTFLSGLGLLAAAYFIHHWIIQIWFKS